jgi:tetratricopeptide (TPR) repeat protein
MVHLASAIGRPVWMMNRFDSEWRWLGPRTDSPWYPKLRIFNQPSFGDWDSVLQDAQSALAGLDIPPAPAKVRSPKALPVTAHATLQARTVQEQAASDAPLSIAQAMQLASQCQSGGRLADAERVLRQILAQQPQHAHAMHLLGVVAHQAGRPELACELITKAIAIEPNAALFHSNLAEMSRQRGQLEAAIAHGVRATELEPSLASAHSNLGVALYDAKRYDEAQSCHEKALELSPNLLQSLNNLGSIERARKNLAGAAAYYRRALEQQPHYLESLSNLGAVLVEDDKADEAAPVLEQALALMPNYPEALCNMGLVRLKQEQAELATQLLQRCLQLRPDYPEAMIGLARALHEQDQLDAAQDMLQRVTALNPDHADAWCQLAGIYMEQGESGPSEAAYQRALQIDPDMADALAGLGNLRLEEGKIDAAQSLLHQAIALKPDNLGARFHLVQVKKVKAGDANLAALEAMISEAGALSADKRISLHYALGKAYDDLKQFDEGFPHFLEGARLKRSKLHYDSQADAARMLRIQQVFTKSYFERLQGAGDPTDVPVFVLGMPRSGTTLTEQIIASHPQVHGAGELRYLMEVAQQARPGAAVQPYPENLAGLTQQTITQWGQDYLQLLRTKAPRSLRITDKMPANYLALGLIPLMLPNAKIIHVQRNPVDTCVSCFTRLFNRHQDATYDLGELGQHYASYARLMAHWRSVLPQGSFMEVQYEDIVADMEGQARRLIDFCGLEWDDACLNFHKNTRSIRTASVTQVRQPIYTSSVERWRNYEKYLGPLLDGLQGYAPLAV